MQAEMTEIVMPGDANHLGTCFGGKIMSWIDMVAAIAANRAVGSVVTASVDSIEFRKPVRVGDIVALKASVNEVWESSMEVGVTVLVQTPTNGVFHGDNPPDTHVVYTKLGDPQQACRAYLTFVAVDNQGKKRSVKDLVLNNPAFDKYEEPYIRRAKEAQQRRDVRLTNRKR